MDRVTSPVVVTAHATRGMLCARRAESAFERGNSVERLATLLAGVFAGIALVVACGDQTAPSSAEPIDGGVGGDDGSPGGGSAGCSGTCTVNGPIAVSGVATPVTVTAATPLPVSGTVGLSGTADVHVTNPVAIAGPVKVVSADMDPAQLFFGTSMGYANTVRSIGTGPLVLTDAVCSRLAGDTTTTVSYCQFAIVTGNTCPTNIDLFAPGFVLNGEAQVHGARYLVPAGSIACTTSFGGGLYWAGFRPY